MSKPDPTAKDRVSRHVSKKKKEGWVQVKVWVRAEDRPKLIRYAERLRGK